MGYTFGVRSRTNLIGVNRLLTKVVTAALNENIIDFSIICGVRTSIEQLAEWQNGDSQLNGIPLGVTLNSIEGTGMSAHQSGEAVDSVPYIDGSSSYEWEHVYLLAEVMRAASKRLNVAITWGAVWDRDLRDLGDLKVEVEKYVQRMAKRNKKAFLDGCHFELRG